MNRSSLLFILPFLGAAGLAACQPLSSPVSPSSTFTSTAILTLPAALTASSTASPGLSSPTPTLIPTQMAGSLAIITYEMTEPPYLEPVLFTSVQGRKFSSSDFSLGDTRFSDRSYYDGMIYCMKNDLDGKPLIACEYYSQDGSQGWVNLTLDGQEIYRIDTGAPNPIDRLQGLWVYEGHWVLETVFTTTHPSGNEVNLDAVGQISVDGMVLNDDLGYDEAFGFQTIQGKPFYFFRRAGQLGFSYDGVETPLPYDTLPHYGCCSASLLNPQAWFNHVNFFGQRGNRWDFVTIGILNP